MNSQIVAINEAVRSKNTFYILSSLIPISLFLTSGFVSVSIIWFFALCLYNYSTHLGERVRSYPMLLFPIILFALNVPWLFFTGDLAGAVDLVLRKIHLFLIPFGLLIVNTTISEKAMNIILGLFLLVCLIVTFVCLVVAVSNMIMHQSLINDQLEPNGYYFLYNSLTVPVNIPPVYLSLFCNLAFVIGLHSPYIHSLAKRILSMYLALFILMISSGIGIATLVVIAFYWSMHSRHGMLARYVMAGIVTAGIVVFFNGRIFLERQLTPNYSERSGDLVTSMPSRLAIWSSAWKAIRQNPLIGYGPAKGQKALEEVYKREGFTWGIKEELNAHNQFLSTFLDLGVIGFLVLSAGLVYSLIFALRLKDQLLISFVIMMCLFLCFESILVRQKGIVFFSFFYSLVFSVLAVNRETLNAQRSR